MGSDRRQLTGYPRNSSIEANVPDPSATLGQYRKSGKFRGGRDDAQKQEQTAQSSFGARRDDGFGPNGRQLVDYFRNPSTDSKFYLEYLMDLPDEAFVDAAFRALLKRPSDPTGLRYYSDHLRGGKPRMWVLDRLVRSAEIRADWQHLPDLAVALGHYRRSHKLRGVLLALRDGMLQRKQNSYGLQKDDRLAMAAVGAKNLSPFVSPEPRCIDDVREADLPDRIKAIVNLLDR